MAWCLSVLQLQSKRDNFLHQVFDPQKRCSPGTSALPCCVTVSWEKKNTLAVITSLVLLVMFEDKLFQQLSKGVATQLPGTDAWLGLSRMGVMEQSWSLLSSLLFGSGSLEGYKHVLFTGILPAFRLWTWAEVRGCRNVIPHSKLTIPQIMVWDTTDC